MLERLSELTTVPLLRGQASLPGPFKTGDLLTLEILARQPSGELRLRTAEGLELNLCLPDLAADWPLSRPLLLRVLASQPRLVLTLEQVVPRQRGQEAGGMADALILRDNPRFSKNKPQNFELANAWRVQLLGTISYLGMRLAQENGHLPAAFLPFSSAVRPELAESASMPLWLWGGPVLRLWFVDEEGESPEPDTPQAAELMLEINLPGWGDIQLLLRYRRHTLVLNLGAGEDCHERLKRLEPVFRNAALRLGAYYFCFTLGLPLAHIQRMPVARAAALLPEQLPLPLFKFAAEALVALESFTTE